MKVRGTGALALTSQPGLSTVFLDGDFQGLTGDADTALVIVTGESEVELKVCHPGHYDLVTKIKIAAGRRQELLAKLVEFGRPWMAPSFAPLLRVGRYVRAKITASSSGLRYRLSGHKGDRRYIMVQGDALILSLSDEGQGAPCRLQASKALMSLTGKSYFELLFVADAEIELIVESAKPSQTCEVVFRYLKSAPPKQQGSRRHLPPPEEN
ncbi:MAG: hypothetical protein V3W41_03620 [Planctomycetota bacterium]